MMFDWMKLFISMEFHNSNRNKSTLLCNFTDTLVSCSYNKKQHVKSKNKLLISMKRVQTMALRCFFSSNGQ